MLGKLRNVLVNHGYGENYVEELTLTHTDRIREGLPDEFVCIYGEATVDGELMQCAVNLNYPEEGWWILTGTKIPSAWVK